MNIMLEIYNFYFFLSRLQNYIYKIILLTAKSNIKNVVKYSVIAAVYVKLLFQNVKND